MNEMIVVLLSWLAAGAAAAVLVGRAGRDRRPDRPVPAPPEPQPDPAAVVAIHGLLQSAGFVEGGIADLRLTGDLQPRAVRNELLEQLHGQATLMREQLAALLADHQELARILDGLDRTARSAGSSLRSG